MQRLQNLLLFIMGSAQALPEVVDATSPLEDLRRKHISTQADERGVSRSSLQAQFHFWQELISSQDRVYLNYNGTRMNDLLLVEEEQWHTATLRRALSRVSDGVLFAGPSFLELHLDADDHLADVDGQLPEYVSFRRAQLIPERDECRDEEQLKSCTLNVFVRPVPLFVPEYEEISAVVFPGGKKDYDYHNLVFLHFEKQRQRTDFLYLDFLYLDFLYLESIGEGDMCGESAVGEILDNVDAEDLRFVLLKADSQNRYDALFLAIWLDRLDLVQRLVEGDVSRGEDALDVAAAGHLNVETVATRIDEVFRGDHNGFEDKHEVRYHCIRTRTTALIESIVAGHSGVMTFFLTHPGISVNFEVEEELTDGFLVAEQYRDQRDPLVYCLDGGAAFHFAVLYDRIDATKSLGKHPAINLELTTNHNGFTAWDLAVFELNAPQCKALAAFPTLKKILRPREIDITDSLDDFMQGVWSAVGDDVSAAELLLWSWLIFDSYYFGDDRSFALHLCSESDRSDDDRAALKDIAKIVADRTGDGSFGPALETVGRLRSRARDEQLKKMGEPFPYMDDLLELLDKYVEIVESCISSEFQPKRKKASP